jgi:DNA polymerase I
LKVLVPLNGSAEKISAEPKGISAEPERHHLRDFQGIEAKTMTTAILQDLRQNGITFNFDGENLQAKGPQAKINEFLPLIKENKPEILKALAERKQSEKDPVSYIDTRDGLFDVEPYIQENGIKKLFVDTETTGLDPLSNDLCLIQIKAGEKVFLIDIGKIGTSDRLGFHLHGIETLLEDKDILKVFHNAVFDLKFLQYHLFQKIRFRNIFDTFLAEKVLTAGLKSGCSLKAVAKKYLNIEMDKAEQTGFKKGQDLTEDQIKYAVNDVEVLSGIFEKQKLELLQAGLIPTARLEFSIIPAVVEIELHGIEIDTQKLEVLKDVLTKERDKLHETLTRLCSGIADEDSQGDLFGRKKEINFNSPVQVKKILSKMGHKVDSTGIETLEKLDSDFARNMVKYRKASKLLSSFVEPLPKHINPKTGRIHPEFPQMGTDTGRFTCQNPNLQQIPHDQEWRDLFTARPGYKILTADYSQIELRIMAEFSQDKAFLEAYRKGIDLHTRTASDVFQVSIDQVTKDQRNVAKTINFGLCYGMTQKGLSSRLNITEDKAQEFIKAYYKAYPVVKNTLDRLGVKAVKEGHSQTVLGRKRYFPKAGSFGQEKAIERKGRNTPIQSTCGDILKKAVFYIQDEIWNMPAWIINLVHDEVVLEFREDGEEIMKAITEECMVKAGRDFLKSVPVEVDITVDNVWRK